MKIAIERHKYAPELNKIIILRSGAKISAPGVSSIRQAREKYFRPLHRSGKVAGIIREDGLGTVCGRHQGWINSTRDLYDFIQTLKLKYPDQMVTLDYVRTMG